MAIFIAISDSKIIKRKNCSTYSVHTHLLNPKLVNKPKLILADEPTGNLDSRTGTEVMELIRGLNESLRMTVVLVTHERDLAEKYADRLVFLADGKIVADQPSTTRATARGDS